MNAVWRESDRERPDPYLDWEYRTRRVEQKEGSWCSVRIQVVAVDDDYLLSLCLLHDAIEEGSLPDDNAKPGDPTIRMADDEFQHLCDLIDDIKNHVVCPPFEDVQMQFFVYRLESLAYTKGDYGRTSFYVTIDTGPPIEKFNDQGAKRTPLAFPPPSLLLNSTVAIGIIDDGIAFAHERFRSGLQRSRIEALWIQEIEHARVPDKGVVFGKRLDNDCINQYLKTCDSEDEIYRAVGVTDFRCNIYNPLASRAAHGTHVLDLASGYSTPKPDRPIFAVQLPSVATIDTSGVTMGSYVLQAARMIMVWADRFKPKIGPHRSVPLVINFSYGLWAGPKDGTQHIERALTELVEYRDKNVGFTRLVLPAGNSYRARATAKIELKAHNHKALDWIVLPDDATANYVEIWLDDEAGPLALSPVEVMLTPPEGASAHPVRPCEGIMNELMVDERPIAGVYYDALETRDRLVLVINPTVRNDQHRDLAPSGRWKVSIRNLSQRKITAHIYVQRDDTPFGYPRRGRQSHLDHPLAYERDEKTGDYRQQAPKCPITYEDTLSSIATCSNIPSDHAIVVGAAEATDDHPPADYTSSGPTKFRSGPDNSAFADDGDAHWGRLAAGTFSGSVVAMRGTSIAAPQIVRHVADQLQMLNSLAFGVSGAISGASALSDQGDVAIPVLPADQARLGKFIFRPAQDGKIPERRYPAVKELE